MLPLSIKLQAGNQAGTSALAGAERDYWLCRCQGFAVYDRDGRVGTVGHVNFTTMLDRPDALAVRVGLLRRRLAIVPVAAVDQIDATNRRLAITATARPDPTGPGRDLRGAGVGG